MFLHFDNDLSFNNRKFKGSLFSIDTEEAKNDIFFALYKGLGISNFRMNINAYSKIGFYNNSFSNGKSRQVIRIRRNHEPKNRDSTAEGLARRMAKGNKRRLACKLLFFYIKTDSRRKEATR